MPGHNSSLLRLSAIVISAALCGFAQAPVTLSPRVRASGLAPGRAITKLDTVGMKALLGRRIRRRSPLVLYLFYTACQPCTDRLPDVERLFVEYRARGLDVALVSIAPMDDERKLSTALSHIDSGIPAFLLDRLDDDFAEEFLLRDWEPVVPSVFFYSPRGKLQYFELQAQSITYLSLSTTAEKLLGRFSGN